MQYACTFRIQSLILNVHMYVFMYMYVITILSFQCDLPYDVDAYNVRVQDVLNAYIEVESGIEV